VRALEKYPKSLVALGLVGIVLQAIYGVYRAPSLDILIFGLVVFAAAWATVLYVVFEAVCWIGRVVRW